MPRPNSGAGRRVGVQKKKKKSAEFKNAQSSAELMGVAVASLVTEYIR